MVSIRDRDGNKILYWYTFGGITDTTEVVAEEGAQIEVIHATLKRTNC